MYLYKHLAWRSSLVFWNWFLWTKCPFLLLGALNFHFDSRRWCRIIERIMNQQYNAPIRLIRFQSLMDNHTIGRDVKLWPYSWEARTESCWHLGLCVSVCVELERCLLRVSLCIMSVASLKQNSCWTNYKAPVSSPSTFLTINWQYEPWLMDFLS